MGIKIELSETGRYARQYREVGWPKTRGFNHYEKTFVGFNEAAFWVAR